MSYTVYSYAIVDDFDKLFRVQDADSLNTYFNKF